MYITENDIKLDNKQSYVEILIKGTGEPWIGGINGKFYRISRGVNVKVPKNLAMLIKANEQVVILSEQRVAEYKRGKGKCLGGKKQ